MAIAVPIAMASGLLAAGPASAAEVYPRPYTGAWTVTGHGNGHGHGMSQYGALGAAKAGKTWQQIIDFYYPGTMRGTITNSTIKVRVASLGSAIEAYPASGLSITWDKGTNVYPLTTTKNGQTIARWRIIPGAKVAGTATKFRLEYLPAGSSTWLLYGTPPVPTTTGAFVNSSSGMVTTRRGSDQVVYRGQVRGVLVGSAGAESLVSVVALPMEDYLRTVVPGEVFASWPADTLGAQAVAARSFAAYSRNAPLTSDYDVYDDTRSQVFEPTYVNGVLKEAPSTNSAISATANVAALYGGKPAFTQFSASDGGWSSAGSKPYLVAQRDDWDAVADNPYNTWTATVRVSSLESRFPSIGTFQKLTINTRNGNGDFGGRVLTATVTGSAGSVNVTGEDLRSSMGIGRSDWFKPTFASAPSYPRDVTGDRRMDLLGIEQSTGAVRVYASTGTGGWKAPIVREPGVWNKYVKVVTAGTFDEDSISDVIYQDSSNNLFLRHGNGDGTFGAGVQIGTRWDTTNLIVPVGDFDGDGLTDLIARRTSDGALVLYPGDGYGRFKSGASRQIGTDWGGFTALLSPGDFNGDGHPDLLARASDGTLYLYPGDGQGGFLPRSVVGNGWNSLNNLTALGDFDGDGKPDVLGRRADGSLWVYYGNGTGGWRGSKAVGSGWNVFSRLLQ